MELGERVKIEGGARREAASLRCAFCHDALGHEDWSCEACGTRLHPDCRAAHGRCPTLACEAPAPARPRAMSPVRRESRAEAQGAVIGFLLGGMLGLVLGVISGDTSGALLVMAALGGPVLGAFAGFACVTAARGLGTSLIDLWRSLGRGRVRSR